MPLPEVTSQEPSRSLSGVLKDIVTSDRSAISLDEVRYILGNRGFPALMVIFACINLIPLPFGSQVILGIPLVLLSWQMVLRRRTIWLPNFVLRQELGQRSFGVIRSRIVPTLEWFERFVKPRHWPFRRANSNFYCGLIMLFLSVCQVAPVPLGNWLPALACGVIALGLSERDGVIFWIGVALGIAAIIVIALVLSLGAVAFDWMLDYVRLM